MKDVLDEDWANKLQENNVFYINIFIRINLF